MAQLAHSQIHDRSHVRDREDRAESSYQMSVPNELIGSVIGKLMNIVQSLFKLTLFQERAEVR